MGFRWALVAIIAGVWCCPGSTLFHGAGAAAGCRGAGARGRVPGLCRGQRPLLRRVPRRVSKYDDSFAAGPQGQPQKQQEQRGTIVGAARAALRRTLQRPSLPTQVGLSAVLFVLHTFVLSQHSLPLGFGSRRVAVDGDVVVGAGVALAGWRHWAATPALRARWPFTPLSPPAGEKAGEDTGDVEDAENDAGGGESRVVRWRGKVMPWKAPARDIEHYVRMIFYLTGIYFGTTALSVLIDRGLPALFAGIGVGLSAQMHDSLVLTATHLVWVLAGAYCLHVGAKPFWGPTSDWLRLRWKEVWVWWAAGGHFVSVLAFKLTASIWMWANGMGGSVPGDAPPVGASSFDASLGWSYLVGSVAPCIVAPIWEEAMYRGFLLPVLLASVASTGKKAMPTAVIWSALIFAVSHADVMAIVPLTVLGLVWALMYIVSGNLSATIVAHMLWNFRVVLCTAFPHLYQ
uniref:CAAX prenyl protease 2/Lysostaphin resistance protein A-like domain-containing protein n=1 Tax=Phaeomonas parva TaxID=124430 RepID=A0A7S1UB10_9STRA